MNIFRFGRFAFSSSSSITRFLQPKHPVINKMRKRKTASKPPTTRKLSSSKITAPTAQWKRPIAVAGIGVVALSIAFFVRWNLRSAFLKPNQILKSDYISGSESKATSNNRLDIAPVYRAKVKDTYDHDLNSFTQGLLWFNGKLYESSGLYGQSALRIIDLPTAEIQQSHQLDEKDFAEGLTIFGKEKRYVLQVLWKVGRGYVYDSNTLEKLYTVDYHGDGWGLASPDSDPDLIYHSDGTSMIKVYRIVENKFTLVREFTVRDGTREVGLVNELEFVKGELWANIWMLDFIARIDPESGKVLSWIDLRGILNEDDIPKGHKIDVLNGIAYDKKSESVYVTGKKWPKLFSIEVTDELVNKSISNVANPFFLNKAHVQYILKNVLA